MTNPAWWYRDLEQNHNYILPLNPQENTCIPFQNNLNTRILEKDYFVAKVPCVASSSSNSASIGVSTSNGTSTSRPNNIVGGNF